MFKQKQEAYFSISRPSSKGRSSPSAMVCTLEYLVRALFGSTPNRPVKILNASILSAVAAARDESPAAAASLRWESVEGHLSALKTTVEFAPDGWHLPRGSANRPAYLILGVGALASRAML